MKHINRPTPFVLSATNFGTLIVNHLDRRTNLAGQTYGVGYQFLSTGSFDPQEIQNVLTLLNLRRQYFGDNVVALDCGANIGAHTIPWSIEMTGWGEVIAIEAQERLYYALAGNIALNNCFNAKAIYSAIGNPTSQPMIDVPIVDYNTPSSFGSLELRQNAQNEFIGQSIDYQKTQKVPLISIDSLQLNRLDFLKIDVEGMELEALNGGLNTIRRYLPIMSVEILKSGHQDIVNLLSPLGYQFFPMDINILAIHCNDPILQHISSSSQ
ncbi:FkbM family methyltransferase [Rodentibacter caecimuris]|uniref:FkbM family methyltransferase n=1 Tax=Rodentibacter caecimuris TaxID=1796644 RepID=A0ABX3KXU1_9PAST|nr:FkbM family methyltransferase [Rodentibacter heylii]